MKWEGHPSRMLVAAHRGERFTAPENTITAFQRAIDAGVDMIETDVRMTKDHELVITLEDGILDGGFGEKISRFYGASDVKTRNYGIKKEFLDRYDVETVMKDNHLTPEQIVEDIKLIIER